jgi:hypothetical protein
MGRLRASLLSVVTVGLLAGCAHGSGTSSAGGSSGITGLAAPSSTPAGAPPTSAAPPSPPPAPVVKALTCDQLRHASVGSQTVSYNGYHDSIPLGDGVWSGEDGATVTFQPQCGIGDLNGDGARDAVGVVALTTGGTGDFYTLVVWRNNGGEPECVAIADLGDRNPVVSVTITAQKATVVYLTRTDSTPMAMVNVRRTATYHLVGSHFTELSHTDAPYSP